LIGLRRMEGHPALLRSDDARGPIRVIRHRRERGKLDPTERLSLQIRDDRNEVQLPYHCNKTLI